MALSDTGPSRGLLAWLLQAVIRYGYALSVIPIPIPAARVEKPRPAAGLVGEAYVQTGLREIEAFLERQR